MTLIFIANWIAVLFSFFVIGVLLGVGFSSRFREAVFEVIKKMERRDLSLARTVHNPVLRPGKYPWEAEAVFNPAAVVLGGRTHLVYRSIGMDGISRLGYASSANGLYFDEHLPYPVYIATNPRNGPAGRIVGRHQSFNPVMYPSGGSWGGCEDPRMVVIGDRVYVTFNMFDGWDFIRIAFISISVDDFLAKRFTTWSGPVLLSKPHQVHKGWSLFPEKINGKFAVLNSISPTIDVAYVDSLEEVGTTKPFIESWVGSRSDLKVREGYWDTHVRSAGPPPLKTPHGWLLFYHANDSREMHRYKLGAMLLDLEDPTKILYRSIRPVLEPDRVYENDGKPGIVYACGATINDGMLYVYYGGADKVVCAAFAPLDDFLAALMRSEEAVLTS